MIKETKGIFTGQDMQGEDGKTYPVNGNYASKSKLVEGDTLKLTITEEGQFVFKQVELVPRRRVIGYIVRDGRALGVKAEQITYKILPTSIYFYKLEEGDEVCIVLPKDHIAEFATIENIIKKLN